MNIIRNLKKSFNIQKCLHSTKSIIPKKLQYVSDIHLEYTRKLPNISVVGNYLALCGDIGHPFKNNYNDFIKYASERWEKIFLLSGNHCYHNEKNPVIIQNMNDIDNKIMEITSKYDNVHYLQKNHFILDNDYVILGTTLWSKIHNGQFYNRRGTLIYNNNIPVDYKFINILHKEQKEWILSTCDNFKDKKVIVLTHHMPSMKMIHPDFNTTNYKYINDWFASDLDYMIKSPIVYWICGHTHRRMEVSVNNIPCLVNPIGYSNEKFEYHDKYIDL